jgi:hypothetical protein
MTKKSKVKLNPTYKQLPGDLGTVQILLKEVLQQTPPEYAEKLADAIRAGKELHLSIMENSRGRGYKCAFRWRVSGGQEQLLEATSCGNENPPGTFNSKGWVS